MQVDSIKPTLTAPGIKRLKLKYDEVLSSFAFNFNLRRYNEDLFSMYHEKLDCNRNTDSLEVGRCQAGGSL